MVLTLFFPIVFHVFNTRGAVLLVLELFLRKMVHSKTSKVPLPCPSATVIVEVVCSKCKFPLKDRKMQYDGRTVLETVAILRAMNFKAFLKALP